MALYEKVEAIRVAVWQLLDETRDLPGDNAKTIRILSDANAALIAMNPKLPDVHERITEIIREAIASDPVDASDYAGPIESILAGVLARALSRVEVDPAHTTWSFDVENGLTIEQGDRSIVLGGSTTRAQLISALREAWEKPEPFDKLVKHDETPAPPVPADPIFGTKLIVAMPGRTVHWEIGPDVLGILLNQFISGLGPAKEGA